MDVLISLFYVLIFPGFLFCLFTGFLLLGIDHKIDALMQKRKGISVLQPFDEFFKLFGKERAAFSENERKIYIIAPVIGLLAVTAISLFLPMNRFNSILNNYGDMAILVYLLAVPALAAVIYRCSSGFHYSGTGVFKEIILMLGYEFPLIIILLAVGCKIGKLTGTDITFSLSAIMKYQISNGPALSIWSLVPAAAAFIMIIPGEVWTTSLRLPEVKNEKIEGAFAVYGGFSSGLQKIIRSIKIFIMAGLFITLFAGGILPMFASESLIVNVFIGIVFHIILAFAAALVIILSIRKAAARIKGKWAFRFFWTFPTLLSIVSLIFVWMGL